MSGKPRKNRATVRTEFVGVRLTSADVRLLDRMVKYYRQEWKLDSISRGKVLAWLIRTGANRIGAAEPETLWDRLQDG